MACLVLIRKAEGIKHEKKMYVRDIIIILVGQDVQVKTRGWGKSQTRQSEPDPKRDSESLELAALLFCPLASTESSVAKCA